MTYLIIFILTLFVFVQIYFSMKDLNQKQTKLEVVFGVTRAIFQVVFAAWLILFTLLGHLGNIRF